MKRKILYSFEVIYSNLSLRSLPLVFTLFLLLGFGFAEKTSAQCIGPYQGFVSSYPKATMQTDGWIFSASANNGTNFSSTSFARSGGYFITLPTTGQSIVTPLLTTPDKFQFYYRSSSATNNVTFRVEYSTDNTFPDTAGAPTILGPTFTTNGTTYTSSGLIDLSAYTNYYVRIRSLGYTPMTSTALSTGTGFTALSGSTTVAINSDDSMSGAIPIGFSFAYNGNTYSNVYASSNGFLSFNPSATTTPTNNLTSPSATLLPLVAPLWDDLDGTSGTASYLTTGAIGSRIFTFEWLNWEWGSAANTPVISFQVKLYEATGRVEFVYRNEAGSLSSPTASVGITGNTVGDFYSLNTLATGAVGSKVTETSTIAVKPTTASQIYGFNGLVAAVVLDDFSWTSRTSSQNLIVVPEFGNTTCNAVSVPSAASGTTYKFYDQGGSFDIYNRSQTQTMYFAPSVLGEKVQLIYKGAGLDNLTPLTTITIYNGSGTGGTVLGTITSSAYPVANTTYTSTDSTGYITVVITNTTSTTFLSASHTGFDFDVKCTALPTITNLLTPTSGCAGANLTITGTNLGSASSVTINGVAATIVSNTSTQIVVTPGAGTTTGSVVVTTTAGIATSTSTYDPNAFSSPTISSQPSSGTQTLCVSGSATNLSVTAAAGSGAILKYDWYSNTTASTTGSTLRTTTTTSATSDTYTPSTASAGTLYYYVVVTNSNGCTVTSSFTGAITVNLSPTTSTNGGNITTCRGATTAALGGSTPTVGTGLWTCTSAPGGGSTSDITFTSASTGNTTAIVAAGATVGAYNLTWTISNAGCTPSSSSLTLTVNAPPTTSTNGGNISSCIGATTVALGGSTPTVGIGLWTCTLAPGGGSTSDITFTSASTGNTTAIVSPTATAGSYTLNWTISNSGCTSSSSTLVLTVNAPPTTSTNGGNISSCKGTTTAALGGNTPTVGTGLWTCTSAPTGGSTSDITFTSASTGNTTAIVATAATAGNYTLTWTISNAGCSPSSSSLTLTIVNSPTITSVTMGGQGICLNGSLTPLEISATAGSGTITNYQWYSNTIASTTGGTPLGTNSPSYTPSSASVGTLYYYCVVTNSNGCSTSSAVSGAIVISNTTAAPAASAATFIGGFNFTANWGSVSGATGYYLDVSTVSNFASFVTGYNNLFVGNVTSYPVTGLSQGTLYYYRVRAVNSCSTSASNSNTSLTTLTLSYCTPSGAGFPQDPSGITNFTMGTINNTTVIETNNYGNYTSISTNVFLGATIPFSVTLSTGFTYDTNIWVDWNNDGDFSDSGELLFQGNSSNAIPTTVNGSFVVPALSSSGGSTLGSHRLRVGAIDFGPFTDPCRNGNYQAFEDYTINVITVPPCSVTTPSAPTTINVAATSATLVWQDAAMTPNTIYNYWVSTNNVAPPNDGSNPIGMGTVTGALTANITGLTLGVQYYFWVRVKCDSSNYSNWIGSATFTTSTLIVVNMTDGSQSTCNAKFYDSGGASSAYINSEIFTYTFTPSSGTGLKAVFNSFNTEPGFDFLTIYDGPTTASPSLGTYSGTQIAAGQTFFSSSSNGGSLTFRFTSDGSVTYSGWDVNITCVNVPTITSFSPSSDCVGATPVITLTGTNFSGATSVKFNGVSATGLTVVSPTTITATLPAGATTGLITVATADATGTSTQPFVVKPIPPTPNAGADVAICNGLSTNLTVNATSTSNFLATTQLGGSGCTGGNMFNIVAGGNPLTITSFDITPNSTGLQNVRVYYRIGTYLGNETNSAAWTLQGTYAVNGVSKVLINMPITNLTIPAGATYGIYLNFDASYTVGTNTYSNPDITINTGSGLCGNFTTNNASRTFNGAVYYNLNVTPTYLWTPSTGLSSTSITNPTANPITTTTYSVTTTVNGCTSASDAVVVTVNSRPTSVISGSQAVCNGSTANLSIALTGTGPWDLTYTNGTTPVTVTGIASSPYNFTTPAITSATTYTVTALSDSRCTAIASDRTGSAVLTINTPPTITIASSAAAVCYSNSSQTTTLAYTATTGSIATYSVVWNSPSGVSGTPNVQTNTNTPFSSSPISITVPAMPDNTIVPNQATIIVKDGVNGCSSIGYTFSTTINIAPTVTMLTNSQTVCYNGTNSQSVNYNYTNANTLNFYDLTWSPISSLSNISNAPFTSTSGTIPITIPAGTAGGTYTGTLTAKNGPCGNGVSRTITLIVSQPSITPAASTAAICESTAAQTTTLTYSNATAFPTTYSINWNASPTNTFATVTDAAIAGSPITINIPANTAANTYTGTITVKNANSCVSSGTNFTVTVNTKPTTSITTPGANICANTVSAVNATGTATSYTWTSTVSNTLFTDTAASAAYLGSNTNVIFVKTPSTATLTVTGALANGCSATASVTFNVATTKTWGGSSWTPGLPDNNGTEDIVFNSGTYTSAGNLSACSCTVSGATVTFNDGHNLSLVNGLNVTSGSITFNSGASLLQTNDVANSGNIIYKRDSQPSFKYDYTYWSSPVASQTLIGLSPGTSWSGFFDYNPLISNWQLSNNSSAMTVGKGYLIRVPNTYPVSPSSPQRFTATFTGVPNNGNIALNVVHNPANNLNLIGNPYPSALNGASFVTDPSISPLLGGSLYFWTHNTNLNLTTGQYTNSDYAVWNMLGGTAVSTTGSGNSAAPTGNIASGQGFFVTTLASGTGTFKNTMRTGGATNADSNFYRNANVTSTNDVPLSIEKHRIWLDIANNSTAFKQMLVGYVQDGTEEMDRLFDAELFDLGNEVVLYSILQDKKLSIQGRGLTFSPQDTFALGFKTTTANSYSITLSQFDGLFDYQDIYLEDKLLNVTHNLKEGPFTFATDAGTFESRFVLRFTNQSLGVPAFDDNTVIVYKQNDIVYVNSGAVPMQEVRIFDVTGRLITSKNTNNATEATFATLPTTNQVLLVQITSDNGDKVTKKIVY